MKPIIDLSKNNDYRSWVKELKQRYLSARLKASIDANRTLLEYYWSLGRDIANKQYTNTYGSGFYKTLSHDLQSEMPEEKGFSESNIRYMYRFYQLYSQSVEKLPQSVENFASSNLPQGVDNFKQQILPQVADDLLKEICSIPWFHQKTIIDKSSNYSPKATAHCFGRSIRPTLKRHPSGRNRFSWRCR